MNRLQRGGQTVVDFPIAEPRDVDDIARGARRRRNRRLTGVGATALVLVAALVVSALAITGDDDDPQVIAGPSDPDALYADAEWHRTVVTEPGSGESPGPSLTLLAFDGDTFAGFAGYEGTSMNTAEAWYSTDGREWSTGPVEVPASGDGIEIRDLVATESGFVAVGRVESDEDGPRAAVWTSPDGRDWRLTVPLAAAAWFERAVVWDGSIWVAGQRLEAPSASRTVIGRLTMSPRVEYTERYSGVGTREPMPIALAATQDLLVATRGSDEFSVLQREGSAGVGGRDRHVTEDGLRVIVAAGDRFVGFDQRSDPERVAVLRSRGGSSWDPEPDAGALHQEGTVLRDAVAVPDGYVAVGSVDREPAVWTSRDGSDWVRVVDASGVFAIESGRAILETVLWTGGDLVIGGSVLEGSKFRSTPAIWATTDELVHEPVTTTTTPGVVTPSPGPVLRPGELALAAGIEGLLAVDTGTGATRVLHELPAATGVAIDVSVAPDGALWYTISAGLSTQIDPSIWRLDSPGTPERVVEFGSAPEVSPDGRFLSYATARAGEAEAGSARPDIVLRDLDTGEERRYTTRADDPEFFRRNGTISSIVWSPDGTRIAYGYEYEGKELYLFAPGEVESLSDARGLEGALTSPVWTGDDELLVLERCCYPEEETELITLRLLSIDLATDAYGEVRVLVALDLRSIAHDGEGRLLGITVGGELWIDADGEPRWLATDVHDAAG